MSQWAPGVHRRIATAIKKHRGGDSAQALADRTAELGYPISRAQIANYESGRKKHLDIAEFLILAAALDIPPLVLLYPGLPGEEVEIIPGYEGSSWDAYLWATGVGPSFLAKGPPSAGAQLLGAVRDRNALMKRLASTEIHAATTVDNEMLRSALSAEVAGIRDEITRLTGVIREAGGVLGDA